MRVEIRDQAILGAVSPLELVAYLRTAGWTEVTREAGRFGIWSLRHDDDSSEILLPLDRTLRDFPNRVREVLATLEKVEDRSELEILHDLATASADVVRARLDTDDPASSSVGLDEGVALVEKARDLLSAAACAALGPRAVYGPRRPRQASEYVKRARLGQTEQGSYVISLISRVAPILDVHMVGDQEEPFERAVTTTLARALLGVQTAAESAVVTGTFDAFRDRVADGVSANLCDALVGMCGGTETPRGLTFEFSWSRTRPLQNHEPYRRASIAPDAVPVIAEAARLFREAIPQENYELLGPVVKLERYGEGRGEATLLGIGEAALRHVRLTLEPPDYAMAVEAHARNQFIEVLGTLTKEGRSWMLREPRGLRIANNE